MTVRTDVMKCTNFCFKFCSSFPNPCTCWAFGASPYFTRNRSSWRMQIAFTKKTADSMSVYSPNMVDKSKRQVEKLVEKLYK